MNDSQVAAGISDRLGRDMENAGVEEFQFSDLKVAQDKMFDSFDKSKYSWQKVEINE